MPKKIKCVRRVEKDRAENQTQLMPQPHFMPLPLLVERIVSGINLDNVLEKPFAKIDFAIRDEEEGSSGWYGIHAVDTGFDSKALTLVADYYGGGCAQMCQLHNGVSKEEAIRILNATILHVLSEFDELPFFVRKDVTLCVDFRGDYSDGIVRLGETLTKTQVNMVKTAFDRCFAEDFVDEDTEE